MLAGAVLSVESALDGDNRSGVAVRIQYWRTSKGQLITADGKAYDFAHLESAPEERHNEEFKRLMDASAMTVQEVANEMGLSFATVTSWCRKAGSKTAYACSAEQLARFKEILKKRKNVA